MDKIKEQLSNDCLLWLAIQIGYKDAFIINGYVYHKEVAKIWRQFDITSDTEQASYVREKIRDWLEIGGIALIWFHVATHNTQSDYPNGSWKVGTNEALVPRWLTTLTGIKTSTEALLAACKYVYEKENKREAL